MLLLVLEHPEVPLQTNGSERDIRDHVKKQKISGGTRSEPGRQCRDTFSSLTKTCRKLGISFWAYLTDRISCRNHVPQLPQLLEQRLVHAACHGSPQLIEQLHIPFRKQCLETTVEALSGGSPLFFCGTVPDRFSSVPGPASLSAFYRSTSSTMTQFLAAWLHTRIRNPHRPFGG